MTLILNYDLFQVDSAKLSLTLGGFVELPLLGRVYPVVISDF
jgi:hypothetical protein